MFYLEVEFCNCHRIFMIKYFRVLPRQWNGGAAPLYWFSMLWGWRASVRPTIATIFSLFPGTELWLKSSRRSLFFKSAVSFLFLWVARPNHLKLLKCKSCLLLFVIYESKWRVFEVWTSGWTKDAIWRCHFGVVQGDPVWYWIHLDVL